MSCRSRSILLGFVVLVAACASAGCGEGGERLTVYSGRTEDLIGPLLEDFNEETGIAIDVRYGDSAELALLLAEEGEKTPADLFISQSPGAVGFLEQRGLLAALDASVLDRVEEGNRSVDGTWVGLSGRQRVLVYNSEVVDPEDLPGSILELTQPRFAGQVALAPANGSFQDFVTAMRQELGDDATLEWLEGMERNDSPSYANNTAIVEAVGRGEVEMGLVNHYYNERALAEDPDAPSVNHYFESDDLGSLVLVTGAAVLESSDQIADATALVEYLLGEDAQTFFSEETFEYPLAAGVDPPSDLPPLSGPATAIDFDALGGDLTGTVELIERSGLSG